MNTLSAILALFAFLVFAGAFRGHKFATLGLGLALLTAAYMVQLIWTTGPHITL